MALGHMVEDAYEYEGMNEGRHCVVLTDRVEINNDITSVQGAWRFYQVPRVDTSASESFFLNASNIPCCCNIFREGHNCPCWMVRSEETHQLKREDYFINKSDAELKGMDLKNLLFQY